MHNTARGTIKDQQQERQALQALRMEQQHQRRATNIIQSEEGKKLKHAIWKWNKRQNQYYAPLVEKEIKVVEETNDLSRSK